MSRDCKYILHTLTLFIIDSGSFESFSKFTFLRYTRLCRLVETNETIVRPPFRIDSALDVRHITTLRAVRFPSSETTRARFISFTRARVRRRYTFNPNGLAATFHPLTATLAYIIIRPLRRNLFTTSRSSK